jgi:hypothetical protein
VILHNGTGKAGTSTVQFFLRDNRAALAESGVLYPRTPGGGRHSQLGLSAKPDAEMRASPEWPRQRQSEPDELRRFVRRRLVAEIEESGLGRVLLSDEVIFGASLPTLRRLAHFCRRIGPSLRLVTYLRRQDDHLVSRYQEEVKVGGVARLDEWASQDLSDFYDYHRRLTRHREIFAPDTLVVRRFEPSSFTDGSLLQDFLDAAGIGVRASALRPVENQNRSLSAEAVEFLRLVNLLRVEREGARVGQIDNRDLVARLAPERSGPTLTLPEEDLDRFMSRWEDSNQAVAREFLDDPSGRLFREPRKVAETITDQRLDPARLPHFLEVAEIQEAWRAPLRRLAEGQARRAARVRRGLGLRRRGR